MPIVEREHAEQHCATLRTDFYSSRVDINLGALTSNVRALRSYIGDDVGMMAVVKSNAYGHGAVRIAREALLAGANMLAVANLVEALELRQEDISAPILVLGYVPAVAAPLAIELDISLALYDACANGAISCCGRDGEGQATRSCQSGHRHGAVGFAVGRNRAALSALVAKRRR